MRYTVLAVGKVKAPYADDEAHYRRLLAKHARVDVVEVADNPSDDGLVQQDRQPWRILTAQDLLSVQPRCYQLVHAIRTLTRP